jgi:hypothetical protein
MIVTCEGFKVKKNADQPKTKRDSPLTAATATGSAVDCGRGGGLEVEEWEGRERSRPAAGAT